jgi:hypothetical protein
VAADPVSAIGVGPNPTERQFRRVLAKAIASELLTIEDKGCLAFHPSLGEPWLVGKDATAVREKLHPRWDQIVYVESYFASELVAHEAQIIAKLEEMMAAPAAEDSVTDKRFRLINLDAITECLQQIELLRPWTRKTHKARRRISS